MPMTEPSRLKKGLPLPPGVTADAFIKRPEPQPSPPGANDEEGEGRAADERHLPFGAMGSSVTLGRLDTAPMVKAVQELFATDPRLTGYLPAFGATAPPAGLSREEDEAQRTNHRELMAALSEANLRVNKDQLLSTGIRVRLRRKSALHSHDVQLRVHGELGEASHLGDIDDWLVRAHSGVAANAQSGRSSSRSIGGMVLAQARLVPGVLTGSARYERQSSGSRRNQGGPTTRTDVLTNGSEKASAFGAALRLNVDVTMTSRQRKLARAVTPGGPGRDAPEAKLLSGLHMEEQNVRLLTPSEFTVGTEEKARLDAGGGQAPGPEQAVGAAGIGELSRAAPAPATGQLVRDWQLVETIGDGQPVPGRVLPHLACPTTSGTGSEVTGLSVILFESLHTKFVLGSRYILPDEAIIDPACTATLPSMVVASSGLDLLSHAIECYTARAYTRWAKVAVPGTRPMIQGANPWSDLHAREALRIVGEYLERGVTDASDHEARDNLSWAASLAGMAFGNCGTHLPHALSYAVSQGARDFQAKDYPAQPSFVPHGISVIVNSPSVFRYTAQAAPERHLEAARYLGADTRDAMPADAGEVVAARIISLMRATGIPNGIGGVGLTQEDASELAQSTIRQRRAIGNAPRDTGLTEITRIFEGAVNYW